MSHTAEIIAVGTEILLGNIANTDAQMLSQSLSTLGVNVFWHTVVGDNPQRLREALDIARHRADIILTTGGLGPTYDDLTKQTICAAFGQKLVLHEDILEDIRAFYQSALHVPMPENNTQQAELPEGCTVFDNPVGTAPGCAFEADGVHVLMLPGPPHECETMLRRGVEPYLRALSKEVIVSHDIMTFGMGESSVDQLLHDRMVRMVNPTLATYAKPCEVRLRATAKAAGAEEAEAMLAGIVLDTKNFVNRTGGRTFEAAAYLRRVGADTQDVQRMFQSDLESMIDRYAIIRQASLYREEIAIAAIDEPCDRVTAAKAADELLTLKGVQASFVFYPKDGGVYISARSLGEINVQVIVEALGGGGNSTSAGGELQSVTVQETLEKLHRTIDGYFEEK